MAPKKTNFQKDVTKLLDYAKEKFKKLGNEISVLAKKSEKEIIKASKAGKIQVDIIGLEVQREKLYYDIGKKAASLNNKKKLHIPEFEPYWKEMRRIELSARKKKKELSAVRGKKR